MKKSIKAVRMERHHKRFGSGGGLNLVSLMDIFTILVFFLLVNSSSAQQLPSSKAVKLPESSAQQLPEETVILIVNNNQLIVQGRVIALVDDVVNTEGNLIQPLLEEMQIQAQSSFKENAEEEGYDITIMGDKQIPYKLLRKVLATLSEANYTNISMAVMKQSDNQNGNGE